MAAASRHPAQEKRWLLLPAATVAHIVSIIAPRATYRIVTPLFLIPAPIRNALGAGCLPMRLVAAADDSPPPQGPSTALRCLPPSPPLPTTSVFAACHHTAPRHCSCRLLRRRRRSRVRHLDATLLRTGYPARVCARACVTLRVQQQQPPRARACRCSRLGRPAACRWRDVRGHVWPHHRLLTCSRGSSAVLSLLATVRFRWVAIRLPGCHILSTQTPWCKTSRRHVGADRRQRGVHPVDTSAQLLV